MDDTLNSRLTNTKSRVNQKISENANQVSEGLDGQLDYILVVSEKNVSNIQVSTSNRNTNFIDNNEGNIIQSNLIDSAFKKDYPSFYSYYLNPDFAIDSTAKSGFN